MPITIDIAVDAIPHGLSCCASGTDKACQASDPLASARLHNVQHPGVKELITFSVHFKLHSSHVNLRSPSRYRDADDAMQ